MSSARARRLSVPWVIAAVACASSMAMAEPQTTTGAVQPASATAPPRAPAHPVVPVKQRTATAPAAPSAIATFPGFMMLPNGGSRIYVQLTASVPVAERRHEGGIVYRFKDTRVIVRNNKNPLVTTHFNTPVDRAFLSPAGHDLELVVDLRAATNPIYRVVVGDDGRAVFEVDFPAGSFARPAPEAPAARPPS